MNPETHEPKRSLLPDCPREYHDDYIGRPARKSPAGWLVIAMVFLFLASGVIYGLSRGVTG